MNAFLLNKIRKARITGGVLILLFSIAASSFATNHYIRQGASGAGDGSDWNNACSAFSNSCAPGSLVRGDTYYVAAGTYNPSGNFAVSGSATITIKGATAADHGTSTGWSNNFGVDTGNKAHFGAGALEFTTGNWTIDGNYATASDNSDAGFVVDFPGEYGSCNNPDGFILGNGSVAVDNIRIVHFAMAACSADTQLVGIEVHTQVTSESNFYLGYSYFTGFQNAVVVGNSSGNVASNAIVEHNYFTKNISYSDHHGEVIDLGYTSGIAIRYNVFTDCTGTACIASNNCPTNHLALHNGAVYGNTFTNSGTGNGIIAAVGGGNSCVIDGTAVYNNTFASATLSGGSIFYDGGGTGNSYNNNIIFNMPGTLNTTATPDYDSYFQATNIPSEAHGQTSNSNPFVNSSAGNYQLVVDTSAELALPAPFNIDMTGIVRTSSRGAYQFVSGSSSSQAQAPAAPTDLQATVQ